MTLWSACRRADFLYRESLECRLVVCIEGNQAGEVQIFLLHVCIAESVREPGYGSGKPG